MKIYEELQTRGLIAQVTGIFRELYGFCRGEFLFLPMVDDYIRQKLLQHPISAAAAALFFGYCGAVFEHNK